MRLFAIVIDYFSFLLFRVLAALDKINKRLDDNSKSLAEIRLNLDKIYWAPPKKDFNINNYRTLIYIGIGLLLNALVTWILNRK